MTGGFSNLEIRTGCAFSAGVLFDDLPAAGFASAVLLLAAEGLPSGAGAGCAVAVIAVNTNSDSVASNLMVRMVKDSMT